MSDTSWTDARVESLKTLWREGLSAAEIARALCGVTRNGVLGKIHRLGLSERAATPRRGGQRPAPARPRPVPRKPPRGPKPPAVAVDAVPERVEGPGRAASVLQLGAHMCHWPIGDPKAVDFSFCGRPADAGGPYCSAHRRIAHRPGKRSPLACDPMVQRVLAGLAA